MIDAVALQWMDEQLVRIWKVLFKLIYRLLSILQKIKQTNINSSSALFFLLDPHDPSEG